MLIVLGGLPGTGKTTVARELGRTLGAVHVRIDTIEQAIRDALVAGKDIGPAGYIVAYGVAADNLALGRVVVADSVNPCAETREAWRLVAAHAAASILEVELVCSDEVQHRHRVETRVPDIVGFASPDWASVRRHDYEPHGGAPLVIDTATLDVEAAVAVIRGAIDRHARLVG